MVEWKTSTSPVAYPEAVFFMEQRVAAIREGSAAEMVWLLEHPPIYTAGTSAKESDLLDAGRFPVYRTGRGGQYTYHGPGQRVGYVMLDLKKRYAPKPPDIRQFVCSVEQWLIDTLGELGVKGERRKGRVGIWVTESAGRESKIAALGIRVRQGVTYHGFSLNINPNIEHFSGIIPCGISEYGVTSLEALGQPVSLQETDRLLKEKFNRIFN